MTGMPTGIDLLSNCPPMRENYHDRIINAYFLNCVKGPE